MNKETIILVALAIIAIMNENEQYSGVEYFMDGEGKNIQVAVYDGGTLRLKRVFPFRADTGQKECSGIAVDPDSRTVYMTSWIDDESSEYLYMYDLDTGDYKGKLKMQPSPKWLQGIACFDGSLYVTSSSIPDCWYNTGMYTYGG